MWIIFIVAYGAPAREPDEGTAAHLFQIWLTVEVIMVGFFSIKWLPRAPIQALLVLGGQVIAALAACAPVYYFHL